MTLKSQVEQAKWSDKRLKLLEELPKCNWDYVKAGIAAGYSKPYAETHLKRVATSDVSFCQAVLARRQATEAETQDRREKRLRDLDIIIDDSHVAYRDRIKAIEVQGKMCGWLSETRVLEVSDRQRQLSEAQQREAYWLAQQRFKCLSGNGLQQANRPVAQTVDADVVETGSKQAENEPAQAKNDQGRGDPSTPTAEPTQPFPCLPPNFSGSSADSGQASSEIVLENPVSGVETGISEGDR